MNVIAFLSLGYTILCACAFVIGYLTGKDNKHGNNDSILRG